MIKTNKKQIFVYREIRKKNILKHTNFNLLKYCIYDLVRRRINEDTNSFEIKYKVLADWLLVSKATITYHIKGLIDMGILIKNDFGLELNNDDDEILSNIINARSKGSFIILDFTNREKLNHSFGFITLEHYAILSLLLSYQLGINNKQPSNNGISRLLLLDRNTVIKGLYKLKSMGLLDDEKKVPENIISSYLFNLKKQFSEKSTRYQNYQYSKWNLYDEL